MVKRINIADLLGERNYFKQGNIAVKNGFMGAAIDNYTKAIKQNQDEGILHILYIVRGISYLSVGDKRCSGDFAKAAEISSYCIPFCNDVINAINSEPRNILAQGLAAKYINEIASVYQENAQSIFPEYLGNAMAEMMEHYNDQNFSVNKYLESSLGIKSRE